MTHPLLRYIQSRPDEGGYIPTFGHIATALDVYRTVAIADVENRPEAWCFTDTASAGALGRLIDGPILGRSDIEQAESALRSILLHDFVDVIVPCAKAIGDKGFVGYLRFDKHQRKEAAFIGMNVVPCRDLLFTVELVGTKDGKIVSSTNVGSGLVGCSVDDQVDNYRKLVSSCSDVANAFPMQVGAASYFSLVQLNNKTMGGPASFIDSLYKRIYRPWTEVAQAEPSLFLDVKLPPFVSIVLSRATNREHIPDVLSALRDELSDVRKDLVRLNNMLDGSTTQAEIHALVRRVNESFDAIVPEALMTDTERRWRRLVSVFSLFKAARQIYSVAVDPLSADPDRFADCFQSTRAAVLKSQRIVSRSVSAEKFADLLRVDSVRDMITSHFRADELQRLRQ